MAWIRWCVPQEDLDQERALAILEGRCPREAMRAYIARERHFHDYTTSMDVPSLAFAVAPMSVYGHPRRTVEGIERRKAYTRDWWRRNGAEYRRRRKASQPGRAVESPPAPQP
jgi:hypothetical protein